jgi:hypothetical protein
VSRWKAISPPLPKSPRINDEELNLVQSLADTEWRLLRIPSLESGSKNGFKFSLAEIELRTMDLDPNLFADYERQLQEAA